MTISAKKMKVTGGAYAAQSTPQQARSWEAPVLGSDVDRRTTVARHCLKNKAVELLIARR